VGQNQGDLYKDGGGGGAGGPGGPAGAGKNGFSSEGDAYGQAGSVGLSYLNPIATGTAIDPTGVAVAFAGPYHDLLPGVGQGGVPGSLAANNGGAVFIFNSFGPRVRTDAGWQEVKTIFININSEWQQTEGLYINENSVWLPVVGIFVPTFESQADDWARVSRPPDRRALPPPPPKVYDTVRNCCCFVAGTLITMADGSTKSIEDVALGEVVLGKDGAHNTVLEFLRPTLGETGATMMAFNGGTPFMTSDHPVWIKDQGWCSFDPEMTYNKYKMTVGQYQIGNIIETQDGTGLEIVSIEEYSNQPQDQTIYNFALDGNNTYIANGLVVHNKGPASCTTSSGTGCSSGSGGCCFIMLEARYGNGTMDSVVRRYRDEKMTDRNRRGYYRLAEVLVPLMRESRVFKFLVTKTFADPLVCYGKYYYGENCWGWIFKPVERFWMRVFDVIGGDTVFIRENGETV
jgi:hypothetical protein